MNYITPSLMSVYSTQVIGRDWRGSWLLGWFIAYQNTPNLHSNSRQNLCTYLVNRRLFIVLQLQDFLSLFFFLLFQIYVILN